MQKRKQFFRNGKLKLQRLSICDFLHQLDKRHSHRFPRALGLSSPSDVNQQLKHQKRRSRAIPNICTPFVIDN